MTYSEKTLTQIKLGNFDLAARELQLALLDDQPDFLFNLAEELQQLGFSDWAKQIYQSLLKSFPEEDQLKTALAEIAINNGQDDQALVYLSQVRPDSPAYLNSLLVAADLYQTQGLFEVSEQKLLTALRIAPHESAVIFGLAELYFNVKRYRSALPFYLQLLKMGQLQLAKVNLVQRVGVCYAETGHFEQALGYLEQIHQRDLDPDILFELAFTQLQLKRYEAAVKSFEKLRETNPDYTSLYPYLAKAYEQQGQQQQALLIDQEGLRVDQYNSKLYLHASKMAQKLSQPVVAEQYLRQILKFDEDNLSALIELSDLLQTQKKYQENIKLLTKAIKTSNDSQLVWNLGRAYSASENDQPALECYRSVQRDFEQETDFWQELALLARRGGDLPLARKAVANYLKIQPNDLTMLDLQNELNEAF
ncbi:tetratricopeptide repeat protein [Liquorilactobacillus sicerae]|uniref:tetratricopeptide repeat protein n=1 Tax=Liquorilactobacillus sicerae TaxID=1416943 RepID=UPI0024802558|nr:tetratricopeptide repeat protein [Liquorilactobacillus sicerae]